MRRAALALLFALALSLPPARSVAAPDAGAVGEMTVDGPAGTAAQTYPITTMLLSLQPVGAPVDPDLVGEKPNTITVLVIGGATPDPFAIGWISGPATRRHVRLAIGGATGPGGPSVYEADDAQLALSGGASWRNGVQTFVLTASHLTINGISVY